MEMSDVIVLDERGEPASECATTPTQISASPAGHPHPHRHHADRGSRRGCCRDARGAAGGGPVGAHARRRAPAVLARPLPHAARPHRVPPRLQGPRRRRRRRGVPCRGHRARPGRRARELLPHRRPPRGERRRRAGRGLYRRGRVVRGGHRVLHPGGGGLPGVPADGAQGRAAAAPHLPRLRPPRRGLPNPPRPGDAVRVRRLRGRVPVQPRGGGRARRGAVHVRCGRDRAGSLFAVAGASVGPRGDPEPSRGVRGPAPGPDGAAAAVPGDGHLDGVHRALQGPVPVADGPPVQRVRGADRQGVAGPHPGLRLREGLPGARVLRHERAAGAPPPRRAPGGFLRQLLLHHARVGARGGRVGGAAARGGAADPGGQEASAVRVRAVEPRGDGGGGGPVPHHVGLPDAAGVGLVAARVRGGGLRVGRAGPRGAAHEPGLHRDVHPGASFGAQARRAAHHPVRRRRRRRRLPQGHDAPRLNSSRVAVGAEENMLLLRRDTDT